MTATVPRRTIARRTKRWVKRRAGRLVQVGGSGRALLVEASWQLLRARLRLALVRFPKIAPTLGNFLPAADARLAAYRAPGDPAVAAVARQVGWAVTRAAEHVPFRAVCLPQAMAAHAMLRRRGIGCALYLGARRSEEKAIDAHAWVDAAGVEVTGYPLSEGMRALGAFV